MTASPPSGLSCGPKSCFSHPESSAGISQCRHDVECPPLSHVTLSMWWCCPVWSGHFLTSGCDWRSGTSLVNAADKCGFSCSEWRLSVCNENSTCLPRNVFQESARGCPFNFVMVGSMAGCQASDSFVSCFVMNCLQSLMINKAIQICNCGFKDLQLQRVHWLTQGIAAAT